MKHPDEGRLLAYLDDELGAEERREVERWLREVPGAAAELEAVRRRNELVTATLARVPVRIADPDRVRERLRERVAEPVGRTPVRRRSWQNRSGLAQAAVLVLFLAAGAAAAVPGSPVREWLGDAFDGREPTDEVAVTAGTDEGRDHPGVRIRPVEGRLLVVLTGLRGGDLEVKLVDEDRGAVYAPPGSRFRSGDGRVEVDVEGGPVRVELPRAAREASVRVDGLVYVEKRGERVEFPGPEGKVETDIYRFPATP